MGAVTICSDCGAQENKVCHCFHCFPIYLLWSDRMPHGSTCHMDEGTYARVFIFWMNIHFWMLSQLFHYLSLSSRSKLNHERRNFTVNRTTEFITSWKKKTSHEKNKLYTFNFIILYIIHFVLLYILHLGSSQVAQMVKNLPAVREDPMPGLGRSHGKGNGNPLPVFLPGEFHGQRSLAGYSP